MPTKNCTFGPTAVTRQRCGKPAVVTFIGHDGKQYAECAEHAITTTSSDTVEVWRHGRIYIGRVIRVKRTGTIVAEITYNNGVKRTVEVES